MDPLDSLLSPGMKLTIAFDDVSLPLPPMKLPDIRGRVIEHVLERAYRAGVEDIHLIAALALHRRMTPAELKRAVGIRIFDEFYPDRLYNHDAEDPTEIVDLGKTRHGEAVELSKRAAESDLLIYVNLNIVTMDGGHKSVAVGLGTYNSVKAHHNVRTMRHSKSFMDPNKSELHNSTNRQGDMVEAAVPIFHIETTLNNDMYDGPLAFLAKPEARWTAREQTTFAAFEAHDGPDEPEAAPRRLPQVHGAVRDHRRAGRRGRARARGHARARRRPAGRRRPRPGGHRHRRVALPRPVQRGLGPEPDPRHVHGARVLLQPLPGRAARARGRRDDLHAPGQRASSTRCITPRTWTSTRKC